MIHYGQFWWLPTATCGWKLGSRSSDPWLVTCPTCTSAHHFDPIQVSETTSTSEEGSTRG